MNSVKVAAPFPFIIFVLMIFATVLLLPQRAVIATTVQRPVTSRPRAMQPPVFTVIHNFADYPSDGAWPVGTLAVKGGALFGVTNMGGSTGLGTVFVALPSGYDRILHNFGSPPDGAEPKAGLTEVGGVFYGTTSSGGGSYCGGYGCGGVFSITSSGISNFIYSFPGADEGAFPEFTDLVSFNGILYGTTLEGGTEGCWPKHGCGVVFGVTPAGHETLLHSFLGKREDGAVAKGTLVAVNGVLYGTTERGGANENGVVYRISPSGKESILYSFKGAPDGIRPHAGLVNIDGVLFGTTEYGGSHGFGTVFTITPSGVERVLYSFGGGDDGSAPIASLVKLNGTLYGTTVSGGNSDNAGTVFAIDRSGVETVVHRFSYLGDNGVSPFGGLAVLNGALYGTTIAGGQHGVGIIYSIRP